MPFEVANSIAIVGNVPLPVPAVPVIEAFTRSPIEIESVWVVSSKIPVVEAVMEIAIFPFAVFILDLIVVVESRVFAER